MNSNGSSQIQRAKLLAPLPECMEVLKCNEGGPVQEDIPAAATATAAATTAPPAAATAETTTKAGHVLQTGRHLLPSLPHHTRELSGILAVLHQDDHIGSYRTWLSCDEICNCSMLHGWSAEKPNTQAVAISSQHSPKQMLAWTSQWDEALMVFVPPVRHQHGRLADQ